MSKSNKVSVADAIKDMFPGLTHVREIPEMDILLVCEELETHPGHSIIGFAANEDEYYFMADPSGSVKQFVVAAKAEAKGWQHVGFPNGNIEKASHDLADLILNRWDEVIGVWE
jgi:hypothetical protein